MMVQWHNMSQWRDGTMAQCTMAQLHNAIVRAGRTQKYHLNCYFRLVPYAKLQLLKSKFIQEYRWKARVILRLMMVPLS